MKKCFGCGKTKSKEEFSKNSGRKDSLQSQCKSCMSKRMRTPKYRAKNRKRNKEWKKQNPEMMLQRMLRRTARRIGIVGQIVIDHYYKQFMKQQAQCAICGQVSDRLYVDHNHSSKQLRGLLCNTCNRGIGFLKDSSIVLQKAANYLEKYKS